MSSHLHKLGITKARTDKHNTIVKVRQALGNRGLKKISSMKDTRKYFTRDPDTILCHLSDLCLEKQQLQPWSPK